MNRRATAAAVAAAAIASLAATAAAPRPRPPVVPWLDRRPVRAAAHPPLAPPCRAPDLHAHLFLQGATGSLVGGVTLLNVGRRPCALLGRPALSFAGPAAARERWRSERLAPSPAAPDVLADPPGSLRALAPGKSASVALAWSNWCGPGSTAGGGPGPPPAALLVGLASGTTIRVPLAAAPRCDAPQLPSTIAAGAFVPTPRHLPASSRLPLRAVIVGPRPVRVKPGLRAFRVRPGARLAYDVALTNTGATPFRFAQSSCPTYVEQVVGAPAQAYVLDCRAVRAIAPHATVLFRMELALPPGVRPGQSSLTWELAPKTFAPPFAAAAVQVAAASAPLALAWLQMTDLAHGYALSGRDPRFYHLLETRDGGRSWSDLTPGAGTVHPSGPLSILGSTLLFSTTLGRGVDAVERSDDGGRSWHRSLPFRDPRGEGAGQPFALDSRHLFLAVDEGAAAGSQGEALYTSADGGRRWRLVSRTEPTHPSHGSLPFGCDKDGFGFATTSRGWAGGDCAGGAPFFYRTDDGGRTWRRQPLAVPKSCACATAAPSFFSPTLGATSVLGFATNGGGPPVASVLWTSDGGDRWVAHRPPVGRAVDVRFADAQSVWVTASPPGRIRAPFDVLARSVDAGLHWQTTRLPFDAGNYRLDPLSGSVAYGFRLAAPSSTIVVTQDGGRSWRTIHARLAGR